MSVLNVGLIGCGRIAELVHLNNLSQMPNVRLTTLAESDANRRNALQENFPKIQVFSDYRDLLSLQEIHAVVICLPNHLHASVAMEALEQGKHVYLEKPLAVNLEEAQKLVEARKRSGLIGMMGFNYRFHALYQIMRSKLQSGDLGDVISVRSVFSSRMRNLPDWKQKLQTGGGVLMDLGMHHADLVRYLLGRDVKSVFAQTTSRYSEGDNAVLELELDNGVRVQSFFSMSSVEKDQFEIFGTSGRLFLDRQQSFHVEFTKTGQVQSYLQSMWSNFRGFIQSPYLYNKILKPTYEPSYYEAMKAFIICVQKNEPIGPSFEDGLHSLQVIQAAEQSAQTGQRVAVSPPLSEITSS